MHSRSLIVLAALLLSASTLLAQSKPVASGSNDWPHWGGPERDGISREIGWSSVGQSTPIWTAELGLGYSNVSITGGRLYTIGFNEEEQQDVVWCLDSETGEEIWSHAFKAEVLANFHGGGSLTTPSLDEDRLYVTHRDGRAYCFDSGSGDLIWERDYATELGFSVSFHGCAASPLVLEDRLIMTLSGVTLAAEKESGELIWRTENYGDGGYSNPVPYELEGRSCILAFTGKGLALLDRESGEQLQLHAWAHKEGGVNAATPIPIGSKVFISSAYGKGAALIELAGEEAGVDWYCRRMRNKVSGCVLWQEHFYGFDESMLKCIDMQGKEQWRVRGMGMGTLSLADGKLIVLTSRGELVVGQASPDEFVELARQKVLEGGVYWTKPVLLDGLIYCRNSLGQLSVRDHRSPAALARAGADGEPQAAGHAGPSPEALFEAHVAAIGGATAWRKHSSLQLDGDILILGAGITRTPMTISYAAPSSWQLSYGLGKFGHVYKTYDGEVAWQLDPFYGDHIEKEESLREIKETCSLLAMLDWRATYVDLKTIGKQPFADGDCWRVAATSKLGSKRSFYFDAESGLLTGRSGEKESQITYEDYREFEGLSLPTKVTAILPDTGAEETYFIQQAAFDKVQPTLFERPGKVLKLLWTPEQLAAENDEARALHAALLGTYVANFGTLTDADVSIQVIEGSLAISFPAQAPIFLTGPDKDGWFSRVEGGSFGVRFEEIEQEVAGLLLLRLQSGEQRLPRKLDE